MSTMPSPYIQDEDALVKLDKAHQALHLVNEQYRADIDRAIREVDLRHGPFLYTAQSVLYEAMSNASLQGFDPDELQQAMGCAGH